MNVVRLNHFLIRTEQLEKSREFFEGVVGLHVGQRPPFRFPGYWMYSENGHPIVHLATPGGDQSEVARYLGAQRAGAGTGCLDHVAFMCAGLATFERRLKQHGYDYFGRTVPDEGLHQLFVDGPDGIRFEFMFPQHEAASWIVDESGVAHT